MSDVQFSTFYVELDCLIDTRLSLLSQYGENCVETVLINGYLERLEDDFPGVDREAFDEAYTNRDNDILRNALMTPIVNMMGDFVHKTNLNAINSPMDLFPKVVVNTYPYDFHRDEQIVLEEALRHYTGPTCPIEFMYMPMEFLTPSAVKNTYSIMVVYRYDLWLEHHSRTGDFERVTCPEVTMIGPRLFFHGLPATDIVETAQSMKMNIFDIIETHCGLLIHLSLLPVSYFSINLANGQTDITRPTAAS